MVYSMGTISVLTISKLDGVSVCNYMYVRKAFLDSLSFSQNKTQQIRHFVCDGIFTQKYSFISF